MFARKVFVGVSWDTWNRLVQRKKNACFLRKRVAIINLCSHRKAGARVDEVRPETRLSNFVAQSEREDSKLYVVAAAASDR